MGRREDIRLDRCWGNCEWNVKVEEREEYYEIQKANNEDNNIRKGCWKAREAESRKKPSFVWLGSQAES